jgi:NAD(P)-dependent dehydrogenase (short-subunit alcohol dehydrogenase family)
MTDMTDKVALVTGASSGIGRATAEAFARQGAKVVVAARRQDELAALVVAIEARGGTASAVTTDVSQAKDVERMVDHVMQVYGRLDYAVNNAGIEGTFAGITDLAEDDWDHVLDINLKGTFLGMKYQARAMLGGQARAGHRQRRLRQLLPRLPHRLGLRHLQAWLDRIDDQCLRRVGAAGDPREPDLSRHHNDADESPAPGPDRG